MHHTKTKSGQDFAVQAVVLNALNLSTMVKKPKSVRVSKFPVNIRQLLLSLQFCASIILIGGALAGYRQVQYLNQKSLGFNKEQIMALVFIISVQTYVSGRANLADSLKEE